MPLFEKQEDKKIAKGEIIFLLTVILIFIIAGVIALTKKGYI